MYYEILVMYYQFKFIENVCIVSLILGWISYFISARVADYDLGSAYECGFEPFEESHRPFTVTFFLVGLLFVLLEIEIILLLPWCVLEDCTYTWPIMMIFFELLLVGFLFEWSRGALKILLR